MIRNFSKGIKCHAQKLDLWANFRNKGLRKRKCNTGKHSQMQQRNTKYKHWSKNICIWKITIYYEILPSCNSRQIARNWNKMCHTFWRMYFMQQKQSLQFLTDKNRTAENMNYLLQASTMKNKVFGKDTKWDDRWFLSIKFKSNTLIHVYIWKVVKTSEVSILKWILWNILYNSFLCLSLEIKHYTWRNLSLLRSCELRIQTLKVIGNYF